MILVRGAAVAQGKRGVIMERIYQLIVRSPKICLGIIALFTAFFAFHAQHIRLDSSVESLLSSDDPGKQYYA